MGLGFAVLSAAAAAAAGGTLDEVAAAAPEAGRGVARRCSTSTPSSTCAAVAGSAAAAALLGSALAVKPLLQLVDGHIEPLEKVRTSAKAIARLEEVAVGMPGSGPVDLAVHHLASPDRADRRSPTGCASGCPGWATCTSARSVPSSGAHVGPGMLAVVVAPR